MNAYGFGIGTRPERRSATRSSFAPPEAFGSTCDVLKKSDLLRLTEPRSAR